MFFDYKRPTFRTFRDFRSSSLDPISNEKFTSTYTSGLVNNNALPDFVIVSLLRTFSLMAAQNCTRFKDTMYSFNDLTGLLQDPKAAILNMTEFGRKNRLLLKYFGKESNVAYIRFLLVLKNESKGRRGHREMIKLLVSKYRNDDWYYRIDKYKIL